MPQPTLLMLCGSLRRASINRKLMRAAGALFPGEVIEGDLRLPLYDGDLEETGLPEAVVRLAGQIRAADALLIACPEYNKAPPGVLKNALDWVSRVKGFPLDGKPVAIVSAASGRSGGERAQSLLRWMLHPLRARVLTHPEVLVAGGAAAFDAAGGLADERAQQLLQTLVSALAAEAAQTAARRSAA
ncbi:MAG: NADPH-dependent FMN reductase [Pararhodobacter sp.]